MRPVDEIETQIQSDTKRCEQEWRNFFKANCNALFQTALLLTTDAPTAEAAVAESIDALDMSSPPEQRSLTAWQKAVVVRSIETSQLSSSAADPVTRFTLQPALLPTIQIERSPRICFVFANAAGLYNRLVRADAWCRGKRCKDAFSDGSPPASTESRSEQGSTLNVR